MLGTCGITYWVRSKWQSWQPIRAEREAYLSFVVVGAGPTGVEVVGQIAELAHRVLPGDYRGIDTRQARIVLVEAGPAVLGPFDERLQRYTTRTLERMGVEVRCATMATEIDADGITVRNDDGEERIEAKTKVWAAGVQASPLAKILASATGAETDRAGRIMVEPDCTLPGHPEVFAIGDMVSLNGLPGIAQPALQEGKYVGKVIRARLDGDTSVAPFKYFDKGTMATIGRTHAVARSGGMSFTGIIAYLMWAFIHVLYLIGWGNRFGTLYSWGRSLWFTKNRAHRTITLDQAIDEIGGHGSATGGDDYRSGNGARQSTSKP